MAEPAITVRDLHFSWPAQGTLRGIDLDVRAGEIFGLVGADGAGKSTLLRVLVGQLAAASGTVRVLGRTPADPALRADIAYMPQGFGLYPDLSVQENLEFFADLHGLPRTQSAPRIAGLLARTGLTGFERTRAGKLSGGMMQKLALACALLSRPRAMFLDEPTTGVDPVSRRAFWRLLEGVRAEGVAILYATANMDEAERCDRIGMLAQGRLERQGTALELVARASGTLLSLSGEAVREHRGLIRTLAGVRLAFPVGRRLNVWLEPGDGADAFGSQLAALDLRLVVERVEPTLYDAALQDLALAGAEPRGASAPEASAGR
jgi:ABC-2 type transport system ATP-binding protein